MKIKIGRRGQTALESAFILLFIISSMSVVTERVVRYGNDITKIAEARALAQGVAMELTMNGTVTHLIRVDETTQNVTVASGQQTVLAVKLYVLSENCVVAQARFRAVLGEPPGGRMATGTGNSNRGWECNGRLYGDTKKFT